MVVLQPSLMRILTSLLVLPVVLQVYASSLNSTAEQTNDFASVDSLQMDLNSRDFSDVGGVHPWVKLQQQINHSRRRLAQMYDQEAPSDAELQDAMKRRQESVPEPRFDFAPPRVKSRPTAKSDDDEQPARAKRFGGDAERRSSGSNRNVDVQSLEARDGYPKAAAQAQDSYSTTDAPDPSAKNSAGLSIEANDVGYFVEAKVGASGTSFQLLVDTGSSDTWVTGSSCNCGNSGLSKMSASTSSSLKMSNDQYKISYGTGDVSLKLGSDKFQVAGLSLDSYTFGVTSSESDDFGSSKIPFNGLIGLGGSSLSVTKKQTLVQALKKNGKISQAIVGIRLGRAADGSGNNKGEITFGGVDQNQISGSITQIDNKSNDGYWEVSIDSVSVGGKQVSGSSSAMLDTGTSLIIAPKNAADAIHNAINGAKSDGQGGYTLPCTTNQQLSFSISGTTFTMDSRDLLFAPQDTNNLDGTCISAVSTGQSEGNAGWLLGAPFLKNVYFAMNSDSNKIGLAKLS